MIEILMAPTGGESGGAGMQLVMILLIGVVFYFFMIRPQSKKMKDQQNFLAELKSGDKVVTVGGMHGKVTEVADAYLMIEIAPGVKIKSEKSGVSVENTKKINA